MPWFLQELRQHCRRRLVERSAAGNHNIAVLLPRSARFLASKTPRCHRPPFSPSFETVQGAWSGKVSVDRFCDQDALFVSQRLCVHFNRGGVLGSVPQTVGTNELVEKNRLPAIYPSRDYMEVGGLMAYAVDWGELGRRMADDVHQILNGTKPGDIPIYQPTKFEFVINIKAAKALGLTLPPELLASADEVIE
jgi:hypothetical protein